MINVMFVMYTMKNVRHDLSLYPSLLYTIISFKGTTNKEGIECLIIMFSYAAYLTLDSCWHEVAHIIQSPFNGFLEITKNHDQNHDSQHYNKQNSLFSIHLPLSLPPPSPSFSVCLPVSFCLSVCLYLFLSHTSQYLISTFT